MRGFLFIAFLVSSTAAFSLRSPVCHDPDSLQPALTNKQLIRLIDSTLELEVVNTADIALLNHYAHALQNTRGAAPTRVKLTRLIDSIFEREQVSAEDIAMLDEYASALRYTSKKNTEFNLNELSFYSASDEQVLFPLGKLDTLPATFNLELENDYLGYYISPCKGVVTSNYGWRDNRIHKGIDIDLNRGDRVVAAFDGKVRLAKCQGGFGNVVILMHPNGLETVYAHLSKIKVKPGDIILSGQTIGLGGNTGHSSGSHLHFEMHYLGHALNPGAIISFTEHRLYHRNITVKNSKHSLCAFPGNSNLHKVNKGESWYLIATKYGLSLKELMALNGVGRRYYLKEGQELRIN